jgi:hypothetical protein
VAFPVSVLADAPVPWCEVSGSIPRQLAMSGFIFLGLALVRLNRLAGNETRPGILLAAVFWNPLVRTFGGRGAADFLPAALVLFSLSMFWSKENTRVVYSALQILALSLDIPATISRSMQRRIKNTSWWRGCHRNEFYLLRAWLFR